MVDLRPLAEGAMGDLWLVAYATTDGAVDVLAYRYRRTPAQVLPKGAPIAAGIALGACAWSGRLRGDMWLSTVGEPNERLLKSTATWLAREVAFGWSTAVVGFRR